MEVDHTELKPASDGGRADGLESYLRETAESALVLDSSKLIEAFVLGCPRRF